MRENSKVTDGLTPRIMGKSRIEGQIDDYPCQSIKCMAELTVTESTPEGMGIV